MEYILIVNLFRDIRSSLGRLLEGLQFGLLCLFRSNLAKTALHEKPQREEAVFFITRGEVMSFAKETLPNKI